MRKRPRRRLAGLITLLIFFSIGLIIGWFLVFPNWRARLFGVQTQGTVTALDDCPESSDNSGGDVVLGVAHPLDDIQDNVKPTVMFTDRQGHAYAVEDSICGSYGVGETVNLWYLASDPTTFSLENDTVPLVVGTLIWAIPVLIILLFLLRSLVRIIVPPGNRQGTVLTGSPPQMGYGQMGYSAMAGSPPQVGNAQMGYGSMPGAQINASATGSYRIGEAVLVEGRWEVTLTNAYPSQGDERAHPVPGRFYLILPLTLRNVSTESLHPNQATFRLYDPANLDYPQVRALEDPLPPMLQPGESLSLTLAYDVPGTQHQFRLSFYPSSSFTAQANWNIGV